MQVEKSSFEDIQKCYELDLAHLSSAWSLDDWQKVDDQSYYYRYVLKEGSVVIGFSLWQVDLIEYSSHLLKMVVGSGQQGRGLGRKLLVESEQNLLDSGVNSFYLEVGVTNHSASALYLSHGYHQINQIKSFYQNGEDAQILYKEV